MSLALIELHREKNLARLPGVASAAKNLETINVAVTPATKALIKGIRDETGVTNVEAMARLFEWFSSMPAKFRLAVLNREASSRDDLLVDWFREHVATKGLKIDPLAPTDVTARVRLAKKLLDEIHAMHDAARFEATAKSKK